MLLPEQYTRPFVTPSGNEVWGIYAKAYRPEAPHAHQGGVLFARTQPLKVFSHPDRTLLYTTDKVDKMVRPILLPPAGMHYAVYEQDYQGVFIHIKSRNDRPESEWGRCPLKIEKENGCEKISLARNPAGDPRQRCIFDERKGVEGHRLP